jgi:1-phosphatidylinositol-4-phosphate 5-kinase
VAQKEDEHPLVGNLIGEDHANYILMYNMLTGIRIAVRPQSLYVRRL